MVFNENGGQHLAWSLKQFAPQGSYQTYFFRLHEFNHGTLICNETLGKIMPMGTFEERIKRVHVRCLRFPDYGNTMSNEQHHTRQVLTPYTYHFSST